MNLSDFWVSFKQKLTTGQKSSLFFALLFLLILPLSLAAILIPTQLKNRASEPITPPVITPSPIPTIAPILVCDPACYFQNDQCNPRITPKPDYHCQINPACSKDCTPEKIAQRGNNYWCTAYCKQIIPTATPTPIVSATPTPSQWCTMVGAIPLTPEGLRMRCCGHLTLCPPPPSQVSTVRGYCKKFCFNTPIDWETPQVSLKADDFYIDVGGRGYHPGTNETTVHSDPGSPIYTTLEVTWFENNTEMRLFIYFAADQNNWWISEIRTYNGENPGNWIIHQIANPNRIRLGQPMSIDGDLTAGVYFQGLQLKAFLCSLKSKGDANCDNKVDLADFFVWRNEFLKYIVSIVPPTGGWKSDFNNDTKVDLKDFFVWRKGFLTR